MHLSLIAKHLKACVPHILQLKQNVQLITNCINSNIQFKVALNKYLINI